MVKEAVYSIDAVGGCSFDQIKSFILAQYRINNSLVDSCIKNYLKKAKNRGSINTQMNETIDFRESKFELGEAAFIEQETIENKRENAKKAIDAKIAAIAAATAVARRL